MSLRPKLWFWAPALGAALACWAGEPPRTVVRATLHNGLRVVLVRDPLAAVVSTVMNYRVGSDEAPGGFPGTAHAQEHMMFRGSPGLSADQLATIGAGMGGDFDADTRQSVTQYDFTVPAGDLDVVLHIEALRMRGVLDTEPLWRQERGAIEQEVEQDLSNPEYVVYTRLLGAMFAGTPYEVDALGTVQSFNRTTAAMLHSFHRTWYAPNNAVLVVAGDIQPNAALAEIRKFFDPIPAKPLPPRPVFHFGEVRPQTLRIATDLPYGLAVIAFRMPGSGSPDYGVARVLSDVLNSRRGSLYALAAEGKALFAGFSLNALPKAGIGYAMAAFPAGADPAPLVTRLRSALERAFKQGVPADLVTAARLRELTGAESRKNSISGLAMDWSESVAVEGRDSPDDDVRAIERVTPADVDSAACQYLDLNRAVIAILTPRASGKPVASKGFKGQESFAATHTKPVALPAWAEKAVNDLTIPRSDVCPTVATLPNGLRLIVQPEKVSSTVTVWGHIRHKSDLETPRGQEGVASVLDGLFSYGTLDLDRLAFQAAVDSIGATESAGTDFSIEVLKAHFDRAVQLLADNELHPALPASAFRIVRREVAATVRGQLRSPDYLAGRALDIALFPKRDPALRQPTPTSVSGLTLEDVKRYYRRVFRPGLTTIVVIGEVTPETARTVIGKYFGEWTAAGPPPPTRLPAVPVNKPAFVSVPDPSRVQDAVSMAETLGRLNRSNPDYYALELGNHVLDGAFFASRFYRDLRENTGLVYYVDADLDVGPTRGIYTVDFGCDPANVARAAAIVRRDLEQMRTTPVSLKDLRRAKALLLHQIPLGEASEDDIAFGLLERSAAGLPLDEPMRAARHYSALSSAQVRAAFAKYIRPGDLAQVTEGPPPK
jgi:zinc protease